MRRVLVPAVLVCFACGGGGGETAGGDAGGDDAAQAGGPRGSGVISVSVRFEGAPPANPAIDMSEEPACVAKHEGGATDPRVLVTDGMLENAFVYVKSGLPAGATYQPPSTPAVLDQDGCLYHPRVFGVMVNQALEIRNSDPLLHNIKAVPTQNRGFNISQPQEGMTSTRQFSTEEVLVPFECNVHGWMHAHVAVLPHPFFGTSGATGSVSIEQLPAGQYELEAWHEVFGTQTQTVTVPETGTVNAEFTFRATTS